MERALRERRERANLLDVVSEELDTKGLSPRTREDVHEAAANGDLAALLHTLDAVVACERELLDEACRGLARPSVSVERPPAGRRRAACLPRARARTCRRARPRARTSRARARSPTRCAGGSSPEPAPDAAARQESDARPDRRTSRSPRRRRAPPRPRRAGRRAGARASHAASRAAAGARARRHARRPGNASANARKRSLEASSCDEPGEGGRCLVHAAGGNGVPRADRSAHLHDSPAFARSESAVHALASDPSTQQPQPPPGALPCPFYDRTEPTRTGVRRDSGSSAPIVPQRRSRGYRVS